MTIDDETLTGEGYKCLGELSGPGDLSRESRFGHLAEDARSLARKGTNVVILFGDTPENEKSVRFYYLPKSE